MEIETLLLVLLVGCVPFAAILYAHTLRRTRELAPELLQRIDPHGFRAMNAGSQVRFCGYLFRRGYRDITDRTLRRLYAAFNGLFWGFCLGWLVLAVLVLR
jgi:hypothetical protein